MNNTDERLRELVIMGCYPGMSYEEIIANIANEKWKKGMEFRNMVSDVAKKMHPKGFNMAQLKEAANELCEREIIISIALVMQAVWNKTKLQAKDYEFSVSGGIAKFMLSKDEMFSWQLTKDGKELFMENQSEETKEKLINLLEA